MDEGRIGWTIHPVFSQGELTLDEMHQLAEQLSQEMESLNEASHSGDGTDILQKQRDFILQNGDDIDELIASGGLESELCLTLLNHYEKLVLNYFAARQSAADLPGDAASQYESLARDVQEAASQLRESYTPDKVQDLHFIDTLDSFYMKTTKAVKLDSLEQHVRSIKDRLQEIKAAPADEANPYTMKELCRFSEILMKDLTDLFEFNELKLQYEHPHPLVILGERMQRQLDALEASPARGYASYITESLKSLEFIEQARQLVRRYEGRDNFFEAAQSRMVELEENGQFELNSSLMQRVAYAPPAGEMK